MKRVALGLIGVVACIWSLHAQRAVQNHRIDLQRFDSAVVNVPGHELSVLISGDETLAGAYFSRKDQQVADFSSTLLKRVEIEK